MSHLFWVFMCIIKQGGKTSHANGKGRVGGKSCGAGGAKKKAGLIEGGGSLLS